jgi:hypothetical protein
MQIKCANSIGVRVEETAESSGGIMVLSVSIWPKIPSVLLYACVCWPENQVHGLQ